MQETINYIKYTKIPLHDIMKNEGDSFVETFTSSINIILQKKRTDFSGHLNREIWTHQFEYNYSPFDKDFKSKEEWINLISTMPNQWKYLNMDFPSMINDDIINTRKYLIEYFKPEYATIYLRHPIICDWILKTYSKLDELNTEDISRALFYLYLEEFKIFTGQITYNKRYIFTHKEYMNIRKCKLTSIVPKVSWLNVYRKNKPNFILHKGANKIHYPIFKYKNLTGNLNGSGVLYLQQNGTLDPNSNFFSDIDIRVSNNIVSDINEYAIAYSKHLNVPLEKEDANYKLRVKNKVIDLYKGPDNMVTSYHCPPVRMNYGENGLTYHTSAVIALLTKQCVDFRLFYNNNKNYIDIIHKYIDMGFDVWLSEEIGAKIQEKYPDVITKDMYLMKKYGNYWYDKWLAWSMHPDNNGTQWKKEKEKMKDLFGESGWTWNEI